MNTQYYNISETFSCYEIQCIEMKELYFAMTIANRTCVEPMLTPIESDRSIINFVSCTFINGLGVKTVLNVVPREIVKIVDEQKENDFQLVNIEAI